jgi:hypothetical protein
MEGCCIGLRVTPDQSPGHPVRSGASPQAGRRCCPSAQRARDTVSVGLPVLGMFTRQHGQFGPQPVAQGVLGRPGLACDTLRPGRQSGVAYVCSRLPIGGHALFPLVRGVPNTQSENVRRCARCRQRRTSAPRLSLPSGTIALTTSLRLAPAAARAAWWRAARDWPTTTPRERHRGLRARLPRLTPGPHVRLSATVCDRQPLCFVFPFILPAANSESATWQNTDSVLRLPCVPVGVWDMRSGLLRRAEGVRVVAGDAGLPRRVRMGGRTVGVTKCECARIGARVIGQRRTNAWPSRKGVQRERPA